MPNDPQLSPAGPPDHGGKRFIPESILRSGLSRRGMLKAMGLLGGVAAVGGGAVGWAAAADAHGAGEGADTLPEGFTGTMADLKHVVILMQENRSFDHYLGGLPGVRGFSDKQTLRFQDGTNVFSQTSAAGVTLPYRLTTVAEIVFSNPHDYITGHEAWNNGQYNNWITAKGTGAMRYLTGEEAPYQWALASAYTVCDQYFCSEMGPTNPNRMYMWSGTANGETINTGGPWTWQDYPSALQAAGVSWRVYVDNTPDSGGWVGDYGDNMVRYWAEYQDYSDAAAIAPGTGWIWRANSFPYAPTGVPDADTNIEALLAPFIDACKPDAEFPLPQVSWLVAPPSWCEHPSADGDPEHGALYIDTVLKALQSNPDIWHHTLFIYTMDENDGLFDHVLPPTPEPGTTDEFTSYASVSYGALDPNGTPIGYGSRVPFILVSPWTRGGWVNSEVFDHTSIVRFLETWTTFLSKQPGATTTPALSTQITAWRRGMSGDLTSAIDFTHPVLDIPSLPDAQALVAIADMAGSTVIASELTADDEWEWDGAPLRPRPLSFHLQGTFSEDRTTGQVSAGLSLVGGWEGKTVCFQVFPDKHQLFSNTPYTVSATTPATYTWDAAQYNGQYAFSVYGPDGFIRSHAGTVVPAGEDALGIPRVDCDLIRGSDPKVTFTLHNDGAEQVHYTLTANDYLGGTQSYWVSGGQSQRVSWPTSDGYYDVILTADTGTGWVHRYAGRVATA